MLRQWQVLSGNREITGRLDAQPAANQALRELLRDDADLSTQSLRDRAAVLDQVTRSYGFQEDPAHSGDSDTLYDRLRGDLQQHRARYAHEEPQARADWWQVAELEKSSDLVAFARALQEARVKKGIAPGHPLLGRLRDMPPRELNRWARQEATVENIALQLPERGYPVRFWGTSPPC